MSAGLFAAELDPGVGAWEVVPAEGGRLRVSFAPGVTTAEVTPLRLASGSLDALTFPWPQSAGPNHLLAIAWHDGDADGRLDLVAAGSAESARVMAWREVGTLYFLTELNWVPELVQAAGRAESALGVARQLDAEMETGWSASLSEATEPPLQ